LWDSADYGKVLAQSSNLASYCARYRARTRLPLRRLLMALARCRTLRGLRGGPPSVRGGERAVLADPPRDGLLAPSVWRVPRVPRSVSYGACTGGKSRRWVSRNGAPGEPHLTMTSPRRSARAGPGVAVGWPSYSSDLKRYWLGELRRAVPYNNSCWRRSDESCWRLSAALDTYMPSHW
jgi:hypothetical protein